MELASSFGFLSLQVDPMASKRSNLQALELEDYTKQMPHQILQYAFCYLALCIHDGRWHHQQDLVCRFQVVCVRNWRTGGGPRPAGSPMGYILIF